MIRRIAIFLLISVYAGAQTSPSTIPSWRSRISTDPALTGQERVDLLLRNNFLSPGALFRAVGPALGGQLRGSPPEWEKNGEGFGRRVGTQLALQTSRGLISSGSAALFGRDPRYQRCDCRGGFRRLGYAFSSLVVGADSNGDRRFDPSNLLAAYGSGYVGASLYPDRYRVAVKGYQLGTQQAGQVMVQNVFLEFGPELRRFRKKVFGR